MPEEFKNVAINGRFGFEFEKKTWSGKSHDYRKVTVFKKLSFQMFSVQTKTELRRVHILPI